MKRLAVFVAIISLAFVAQAATPGKGDDIDGPVVKAGSIGGPDGYGYLYIDSSENNGYEPTYSFVDITTTGTAMGITGDDGVSDAVIAFGFPLYGLEYSAAHIGNNGGLYLSETNYSFIAYNVCPMPWHSGAPIAPQINVFWDDIDSDTGDVYFENQVSCAHPDCGGACFIVEWYDRPRYPNLGSGTFEVILCDSGVIIAQYADLDFGDPRYDFGASATVGIEDDHQDPTYFLEYSCNTADLADGLAIMYTTDPVPVELMSFDID